MFYKSSCFWEIYINWAYFIGSNSVIFVQLMYDSCLLYRCWKHTSTASNSKRGSDDVWCLHILASFIFLKRFDTDFCVDFASFIKNSLSEKTYKCLRGLRISTSILSAARMHNSTKTEVNKYDAYDNKKVWELCWKIQACTTFLKNIFGCSIIDLKSFLPF